MLINKYTPQPENLTLAQELFNSGEIIAECQPLIAGNEWQPSYLQLDEEYQAGDLYLHTDGLFYKVLGVLIEGEKN